MKTDKQSEIEQDFLVAMTDLIIALRDIMHKMDNLELFLGGYSKTLQRIEDKIDTVTRQTIKEEYVKGPEDYGDS